MTNITLKQLRALVAVASEGSFTKAATKLHVTQSTLTSAIKMIEGEIGIRMFDRTTREVSLTREGALFLPTVQRTLDELESAIDGLRQIADHEQGSVVVAGAGSFISYVLSPSMLRLAQAHPRINVRLAEAPTANVLQMVLSGEADFGVTTLLEDEPKIDVAPLLSDVFCAVFTPEHALSGAKDNLSWHDLKGLRSIRLHNSNGIRTLLNRLPEFKSLTSETAYEVGLASSLHSLLNAGFGYAAVPAMTARYLQNEGLAFKRIGQPTIRRTLTAIKRKGKALSPSAIAFFKVMLDNLQKAEEESLIDITVKPGDIDLFYDQP